MGRSLTPTRKPPVFCDLCSRLAVAELDAAPLCTRCLLAELAALGEAGRRPEDIVPLELAPPTAPRGFRPRSDDDDPDINNVA
jgi:hypothetical protein